jgi:outer membrane protein assembly factor BamB
MLPLSADDPRVIGEFRLHTRLGAGGMGRVYLASSPGGRAVAVKVIHSHLARDAAFVGRFRREVAAAQAVNGSYAAPVVAAGPDDDPPWLATAYVAGPSLQAAVTETGPLPEEAVLKLAAGLAEALRAIHDGGLVHRDLKPDNVLLAADGPRVIDFGIARALDSTGLTSLTSTGSVLGTPSYMSPEQAQGQPTGPASDVFALGGVVYFAATGMRPFGSGNAAGLLYRIVHTEPDLEPVPARLRELVAGCLAKDPARRPTLAELAASLMDAAQPGDSPSAFWPAPVARLIADHQARFAAGLQAGEPPTGRTPTMAVAPVAPDAPDAPDAQASATPPADLPATRPPATRPPATATVPPPAVIARPTQPQPVPPMGRRRALALLAGAASAGLVVAGWELTRPGPPAAKDLAAVKQSAAQRRVSSLRPGTGLWSFETNAAVASLVVNGGVVYVGTAQQAVYALDALTGKPLWHHLMEKGQTYFLALANGAVIAADGYNGVAPTDYIGGVYALDAGTGKLLWSTDAVDVIGLDAAGDVAYVGNGLKNPLTGGVTAVSARTGELLWTFNFPEPIDPDSGLVQSGGVVYVTTGLGEILALDASTGGQLWRYNDPAIAFRTPPAIAGGIVYASNSQNRRSSASPVLYAIQARTGRVLWQRPLGPGLSSFIAGFAAGLVFVGVVRADNAASPAASELCALNAATGQPLWQIPVTGAAWSATPGAGNAIYTGNNAGVLDAWQVTTGNHLWSYRAAGALDGNIAVADGIAYVGSSNHRVYAVTTGA